MPFYVQKLPGHISVVDATYKRCWWPKRCWYSGKFLMFRKAYCVSGFLIDEVNHRVIFTWVDRDNYLIMKLKGEL